MNKRPWLDAAEIFDAWRVVPRLILFGYCYWVAHVTDSLLSWYQLIPSGERSLESAGFSGAVITAVTGLAVWVYKIYAETGRDWTQNASSATTIVQTTQQGTSK